MGTYTTNFNIYKPSLSETGWDDEVNAGFDAIDNELATHDHDGTPSTGTLNPTTLTVSGRVRFSGVVTSAITTDVNDHAPTGIDACGILKFTSDANRSVTGLSASSADNGRYLFIANQNSSSSGINITLKHASTSSSAANRFVLPNGADLELAPQEGALFIYHGFTSRWTYAGGAYPASGAGTGGTMPGATVVLSGSTYTAYSPTGGTISSGTNAAAVIQAALDAGHVTYLQKATYNCTSAIVMSEKQQLIGPDLNTFAGTTPGCLIKATATISGGLVQVAGYNGTLFGVNVDADSKADYAIEVTGPQSTVSHCNASNGKIISLYVNGPDGAARDNVVATNVDNAAASPSYTVTSVDTTADTLTIGSHKLIVDSAVQITSTGSVPGGITSGKTYWVRDKTATTITLQSAGFSPNSSSAVNITSAGSGTITVQKIDNASCWIQGPDHVVSHLRIEGAPSKGYALVVAGQHTQLTGGHVTANSTVTANTLIQGGGENVINGILWDTMGDGTNGTDMVVLSSSRNAISGCQTMNSKTASGDCIVFRKQASGDYIVGNVIVGNAFTGDGPTNLTFANGVAFYDESGNVVTNFGRFNGTKITNNTFAATTAFTNVNLTTVSNRDAVYLENNDRPQSSSVTGQTWRTTARGSSPQNGNATSYTIAHGLGGTPSWANVVAGSAAARAGGAVSIALDSTNITITTTSTTTAGTNNTTWYWEARL